METIQEPRPGFINRLTNAFRKQPEQSITIQRTLEDEALLDDVDLLGRARQFPLIQRSAPSSLPNHNPNPPEPIPFTKKNTK